MKENKNWKRVFGQKLRHMSVEECKAFVEAEKDHIGIGSQRIRDLTGGYSCQSIDFHVRRAVGLKALK